MKRSLIPTLLIFVLALASFVTHAPSASAGDFPWRDVVKTVGGKHPYPIFPFPVDVVPTVGSVVTYGGHVASFDLSYSGPRPPLVTSCVATITDDNPERGPVGFVATVSINPQYAEEEASSTESNTLALERYYFRLSILCKQLQASFFYGHKVSVRGMIEKLGKTNPKELGSLRVLAISSSPDGSPSEDALNPAMICVPGLECSADGIVVKFSGDSGNLNDESPFCKALLKTTSASGEEQKLFSSVPMAAMERNNMSQYRRLLRAQASTCGALLSSMNSQKKITLKGRGSGASLPVSRIVGGEDFSTVDLSPAF